MYVAATSLYLIPPCRTVNQMVSKISDARQEGAGVKHSAPPGKCGRMSVDGRGVTLTGGVYSTQLQSAMV